MNPFSAASDKTPWMYTTTALKSFRFDGSSVCLITLLLTPSSLFSRLATTSIAGNSSATISTSLPQPESAANDIRTIPTTFMPKAFKAPHLKPRKKLLAFVSNSSHPDIRRSAHHFLQAFLHLPKPRLQARMPGVKSLAHPGLIVVSSLFPILTLTTAAFGGVNVTQFHNHDNRDGLYIDPAFTHSASAGLNRDLPFQA